MNQSINKSNNVSRARPSPALSNKKEVSIRPKRCHNCQKMIVADKYESHIQSCFRIKDEQKVNNSERNNSNAQTPISLNKGSTLNSTQSKVLHQGLQKNHRTNSNMNKTRLIVSNNVIVPGKANSNITRKGPHKNIINSNLGQRKYKKNQNPEQHQKDPEKHQVQAHFEQQNGKQPQIFKQQPEKVQKREEASNQNYNSQAAERPGSRNIRTHSRPGSATRQTMQIRVAQESAWLANMYNSNTNRPVLDQRQNGIMRNSQIDQNQINQIRNHHRMVSLSSDSGYESSQLNEAIQNGSNFQLENRRLSQAVVSNQRMAPQQQQRKKAEKQRMDKIRAQQIEKLRQRQRQKQTELQRQRQRLLERERQRQIERERQRQIERQRQRQRQRERQRQRQRERQRERQQLQRQRERQRQRQSQEPRVNIDLLVQTTNQIINFVEELALSDDSLTDMLLQLRQLNAISIQIQQLNGLGRNLGFRMGVVFAQRIQQLQNVIMNQIGIVLIRNFHDNISQDFQRLLNMRPSTHSIIVNCGFKKAQIENLFPLKRSNQIGQCSICLEDIKMRQEVRELQCKHTFHPDCIDGWMAESRKCPMCRHEQKIS